MLDTEKTHPETGGCNGVRKEIKEESQNDDTFLEGAESHANCVNPSLFQDTFDQIVVEL